MRNRRSRIEAQLRASLTAGDGLETACHRIGVTTALLRAWMRSEPRFTARLGRWRRLGERRVP
jgi:hypothetical protein